MPPLLTVSTGPLWRLDLERAFEILRGAGAEGVEIMVTQSPETQTPNELEKLANRYDLPIVAIHAPQLLLTRTVFGTNPVEKVRKTAELCESLDVKVIVLHPPYLWQTRYTSWVTTELEDLLTESGAAITMENMYPVHVGRSRLSFHRWRGSSGLDRFRYVTLDTSHMAVSEEDPLETYNALRDRTIHIHLSDNRGKGRDSHAPLGEGVLPIESFVRALDGPALRSIALEIEPGPARQDPSDLEQLFGSSLELVRRNLPSETGGNTAPPVDPPTATPSETGGKKAPPVDPPSRSARQK